MSQHRRRSPGKRAHRRVGVFMITSMAAILAITAGAYVTLHSQAHGHSDPLAAAAADIPSSHAASLLEQRREHMIELDAASKTMAVESSPKLAAQPAASVAASTGAPTGTVADAADDGTAAPAPAPDPGTAQAVAYKLLPSLGFSASGQYGCVNDIFTRESGWRYNAENASGAYGIPQALPGSKMATAGPDWETNVTTQITWGIDYMKERYGSPCQAWSFWQAHGWY